ncbi:hypothetical protein D3C72_1218200 [compost metagenome]
MRLVGVVVAGRDPAQVRLAQVRRNPRHHLPHIAPQVGYPVAVLRRDNEAEMMAVPAPAPRLDRRLHAVIRAVEEVRPRPFDARPRPSDIGDVRRQRPCPRRCLADVSRHQCLHDDPLTDIHAKGPARPSLRRPEHARTIAQGELSRRRQPLEHARADRNPISLQGQGKADLDAPKVPHRASGQPSFDRLADEHVAPPE